MMKVKVLRQFLKFQNKRESFFLKSITFKKGFKYRENIKASYKKLKSSLKIVFMSLFASFLTKLKAMWLFICYENKVLSWQVKGQHQTKA